ncbi:hypothetical protein CAI21_22195 [Alkalilimnicola ehrlichii]|uniref:hypothetical protein n=1 Tax=Alkalilimnicola ehrlichii TaxID=351052 RepID=UPI000E2E75EE|nr:hypothetical protein [Alkalilimnicola ehrlichii]RFA24305.1 hypothetical protein CAI21_22195 [Alkalilimnicola ehrlichii]
MFNTYSVISSGENDEEVLARGLLDRVDTRLAEAGLACTASVFDQLPARESYRLWLAPVDPQADYDEAAQQRLGLLGELQGHYPIPLGDIAAHHRDEALECELETLKCLPVTANAAGELIPLRDGWLYIFRNGCIWRELQVLAESTQFQEVNLIAQQGRDARTPSVYPQDGVLQLPVSLGGEEIDYHFAFSPVQWPWDYLLTLSADIGADRRFDPACGAAARGVTINAARQAERLQKIALADYRFDAIEPEQLGASADTASAGAPPTVDELYGDYGYKVPLRSALARFPEQLAALADFAERLGNRPLLVLADPIGVAEELAAKHQADWVIANHTVKTATGLPDDSKPEEHESEAAYRAHLWRQDQRSHRFNTANFLYQLLFANAELEQAVERECSREQAEQLAKWRGLINQTALERDLRVPAVAQCYLNLINSRPRLVEWLLKEGPLSFTAAFDDYAALHGEAMPQRYELLQRLLLRLDANPEVYDKWIAGENGESEGKADELHVDCGQEYCLQLLGVHEGKPPLPITRYLLPGYEPGADAEYVSALRAEAIPPGEPGFDPTPLLEATAHTSSPGLPELARRVLQGWTALLGQAENVQTHLAHSRYNNEREAFHQAREALAQAEAGQRQAADWAQATEQARRVVESREAERERARLEANYRQTQAHTAAAQAEYDAYRALVDEQTTQHLLYKREVERYGAAEAEARGRYTPLRQEYLRLEYPAAQELKRYIEAYRRLAHSLEALDDSYLALDRRIADLDAEIRQADIDHRLAQQERTAARDDLMGKLGRYHGRKRRGERWEVAQRQERETRLRRHQLRQRRQADRYLLSTLDQAYADAGLERPQPGRRRSPSEVTASAEQVSGGNTGRASLGAHHARMLRMVNVSALRFDQFPLATAHGMVPPGVQPIVANELQAELKQRYPAWANADPRAVAEARTEHLAGALAEGVATQGRGLFGELRQSLASTHVATGLIASERPLPRAASVGELLDIIAQQEAPYRDTERVLAHYLDYLEEAISFEGPSARQASVQRNRIGKQLERVAADIEHAADGKAVATRGYLESAVSLAIAETRAKHGKADLLAAQATEADARQAWQAAEDERVHRITDAQQAHTAQEAANRTLAEAKANAPAELRHRPGGILPHQARLLVQRLNRNFSLPQARNLGLLLPLSAVEVLNFRSAWESARDNLSVATGLVAASAVLDSVAMTMQWLQAARIAAAGLNQALVLEVANEAWKNFRTYGVYTIDTDGLSAGEKAAKNAVFRTAHVLLYTSAFTSFASAFSAVVMTMDAWHQWRRGHRAGARSAAAGRSLTALAYADAGYALRWLGTQVAGRSAWLGLAFLRFLFWGGLVVTLALEILFYLMRQTVQEYYLNNTPWGAASYRDMRHWLQDSGLMYRDIIGVFALWPQLTAPAWSMGNPNEGLKELQIFLPQFSEASVAELDWEHLYHYSEEQHVFTAGSYEDLKRFIEPDSRHTEPGLHLILGGTRVQAYAGRVQLAHGTVAERVPRWFAGLYQGAKAGQGLAATAEVARRDGGLRITLRLPVEALPHRGYHHFMLKLRYWPLGADHRFGMNEIPISFPYPEAGAAAPTDWLTLYAPSAYKVRSPAPGAGERRRREEERPGGAC